MTSRLQALHSIQIKKVDLHSLCGSKTRYIIKNVQRRHGNRHRHQKYQGKNLSQTSHTHTDLVSVEYAESNE